jgi:hypothetical protein
VIAFKVGHGVPATGVIGEVPAIVDIVNGIGSGVCCADAVSEKIEKKAERRNTNLTAGANRGMEASGYEGMRNMIRTDFCPHTRYIAPKNATSESLTAARPQ